MMITQVKPKRQVKELDRYLKGEIGEAIIQLTELTKPSEIIFAKVEKLKKDLDFWQVKIPSFKDEDRVWSGYEYYAKKL